MVKVRSSRRRYGLLVGVDAGDSGHLLSESIPASSSPGFQHRNPEKASFLFAADAMPTLNQFEPKTGAATFDTMSTVRVNEGERPMASSEGTNQNQFENHKIPGPRVSEDAKNDEPQTTRDGTPHGEPSSARQSTQSDHHETAAAAYETQAESMMTSQADSLLNTQAPSSPLHIQTAEQIREIVVGEEKQQELPHDPTKEERQSNDSTSKLTLLPEGASLHNAFLRFRIVTHIANRQPRCNRTE